MHANAIYSTLAQVNSKILACNKCKTMNQGQRRVLGVGTTRALVSFIGEAPGRLGADQTGVPFTQDRSGKLLRDLIVKIGLSTEDVYISNVVKCNPRDECGRNRRPSRKEITNCREYLRAELKLIKAQVLVPLGKLASFELLGFRRSMKEINAQKFFNEQHGWIFPLFHPGYIIRGNYSIDRYRKDFNRLKKLFMKQE